MQNARRQPRLMISPGWRPGYRPQSIGFFAAVGRGAAGFAGAVAGAAGLPLPCFAGAGTGAAARIGALASAEAVTEGEAEATGATVEPAGTGVPGAGSPLGAAAGAVEAGDVLAVFRTSAVPGAALCASPEPAGAPLDISAQAPSAKTQAATPPATHGARDLRANGFDGGRELVAPTMDPPVFSTGAGGEGAGSSSARGSERR